MKLTNESCGREKIGGRQVVLFFLILLFNHHQHFQQLVLLCRQQQKVKIYKTHSHKKFSLSILLDKKPVGVCGVMISILHNKRNIKFQQSRNNNKNFNQQHIFRCYSPKINKHVPSCSSHEAIIFVSQYLQSQFIDKNFTVCIK